MRADVRARYSLMYISVDGWLSGGRIGHFNDAVNLSVSMPRTAVQNPSTKPTKAATVTGRPKAI